MDLEAGRARVKREGETTDKPSRSLRPSADETVLRSPVSDGLDYVVFAGPKAGRRHWRPTARLTGHVPLLPLWAYGYIHCRERYPSSEEILDNAREFRDARLPMDVIVQDWQYWGKYGWNAMRFDERHYPDPADWSGDLHDMHARLMVSVWSKIERNSELVGKEFAARRLLPRRHRLGGLLQSRRGRALLERVQRAAAVARHRRVVAGRRPSRKTTTWPAARRPPAPASACALIYPAVGHEDGLRGPAQGRAGQRVFILTRCAFRGEQRYARRDLVGRHRPRLGDASPADPRRAELLADRTALLDDRLRAASSGPAPASTRDAGYHERFLRWFQFATFCRCSASTATRPTRSSGATAQRWKREARRYLDLRYRLLPYIYSEAAEMTFDGSTLMRPLVMDFPPTPRR